MKESVVHKPVLRPLAVAINPALKDRPVAWEPSAKQCELLACDDFEVLYGGAAGGGKSDFLLAGALRYIHHRQFAGVFFRRSFPELEDAVERAREIFEPFGGHYNKNESVFRFPEGSRFYLLHLQLDADAFKHRGRAYQYIAFDELTTFSEFQYRYLMSRARSAHGIPIEVRSGTNPEPGWVKQRWAPWVDEKWEGERAQPGQILWYKNDPATGLERYVPHGTKGALSRTFMPARLADNKKLGEDYADRLAATQDAVQVARLLGGDWSADYKPGIMFRRSFFRLVKDVPANAIRVRAWDLAATEEKLNTAKSLRPESKNDPDWTVGLLYGWAPEFGFFIEHIERLRGRPEQARQAIERITMQDAAKYGRGKVLTTLPKDPGAAGKTVAEAYADMLSGHLVKTVTPYGKKVVRAGPASSTAENLGIAIVEGHWNDEFFHEAERFPKGLHDDQIDALSDAHFEIATIRGMAPPPGRRRNLSGLVL